jgi:alpha-mannosidase
MKGILPLFILLLDVTLSAAPVGQPDRSDKPVLYYIPHTHWEGAVFDTREEYLQFGLDHILQAMRLLDKYPSYKFTLDQVAYVKPFIERYPEQVARFKQFIKEGRLEIVGGMDIMPDEVKPGSELLVRQIQYGQGYCKEVFGRVCDIAWLLDTFGHTPQLPQILDEAGFKSFWYCRGTPDPDEPSEFNLQALDGSTVLTMWLPGFYGLFYGPPRNQDGFDRFFIDHYNSLDKNAQLAERVGLAGVDVSEPEDYVTPLLNHFNAEENRPFTIRYSVPSEFAAVVAKRKNVPTKSFDLNPIFTGSFSSRTELRQVAKGLERDLLHAEELAVLSEWLGAPSNSKDLWEAWEPILFNQTHDLASGTMNDHTYFDTIRQYEVARGMTDNLLASGWKNFAAHIDTSGDGAAIIIFNPQGWLRTDSVDVDVGFTQPQFGIRVLDPAGRAVPYQATTVEKYGDGALERLKLTFVATDVPAIGYAVYRAVPSSSCATADVTSDATNPNIENEFYRVTVDPKTGAMTGIFDKSLNQEMLSGAANVVSRISDKGDLWTLYHPLDGGQYLPTLDKQPVPTTPNAVLSTEFGEKNGTFRRGPVFEEFEVEHPFDKGMFSTKIRLTRGVKRIAIETQLVNQTGHVRYQVLFPTTIARGDNVQEVAFGAIERPLGIEYPAQNWVDTSAARQGVALLNFAMPGNVNADGTLMLSLLRSVTEGDYNGGDQSNTGLEINVPRTFRYALVPHAGGWRSARLAQAGEDFASPLIAMKAEPHKGLLPKVWQGLSCSSPNVVLSSIQPGDNGVTLVRFYESTGRPAMGVRLHFGPKVVSAELSDLLGDSHGDLRVERNAVTLDLHGFEIKTIKLHLAKGRLGG